MQAGHIFYARDGTGAIIDAGDPHTLSSADYSPPPILVRRPTNHVPQWEASIVAVDLRVMHVMVVSDHVQWLGK